MDSGNKSILIASESNSNISGARANTINSTSTGVAVNYGFISNSSHLNFDLDEELEDTIDNLYNILKVKYAESEKLQITLEKIKKSNTELAAENRELKLHIETINKQIELREELNETLRNQLKHMKGSHARMTAFRNKSYDGLVSDFASHVALYYSADRRSQQAQQQPQLAMQPSTSDQPVSKFFDFNRKN